ncbi:MAG: DinB family protein [Candidatus Limnocylindria bacterium]
MADPLARTLELAQDMVQARQEFLEAVADIDPALLTSPGLVGVWSARELIAHMGYWAGHAAEAVHHAEQGRLDEFDVDAPSVDDRNAVVARVAGETDMATVRSREELAFEAFRKRVLSADPEWLSERDADGDTLEEIILYDGADHYREHTSDIRAWFAAGGASESDADQLDD